jgi:hypothetical protein
VPTAQPRHSARSSKPTGSSKKTSIYGGDEEFVPSSQSLPTLLLADFGVHLIKFQLHIPGLPGAVITGVGVAVEVTALSILFYTVPPLLELPSGCQR